jgi:hypothetical protein
MRAIVKGVNEVKKNKQINTFVAISEWCDFWNPLGYWLNNILSFKLY